MIDLIEIYVHWDAKRSQVQIGDSLGIDGKTVRLHTETKGIHHLVKEVKKLRKAVEPITKKNLTVEVYDGPSRNSQRVEAREEQRRRVRAFEEQQPSRGCRGVGE